MRKLTAEELAMRDQEGRARAAMKHRVVDCADEVIPETESETESEDEVCLTLLSLDLSLHLIFGSGSQQQKL